MRFVGMISVSGGYIFARARVLMIVELSGFSSMRLNVLLIECRDVELLVQNKKYLKKYFVA